MGKQPLSLFSQKRSIELLQYYWGYEQFRPLQKEVIDSILLGNDILTLMPTGGGKSICYQLPALLVEGCCIVISPLIALMQDQVVQLQQRNIAAAALYTGMTVEERDRILHQCRAGKIKLLYLSPERIQTRSFQEALQQVKISFLAVDEAHCIAQWGNDFRPAYLKVATLRNLFPSLSIIALTATATPNVQKEIINRLQLRHPEIYTTSFARSNLTYIVRHVSNKETKMIEVVKQVKGSMIIYGSSRLACERMSQILIDKGLRATYYHAGLSSSDRTERQQSWLRDEVEIIVATNAFGMGIDKSNVRAVIHMDPPMSLESYYQEAGRAGRDGRHAYALILYNRSDIKKMKDAIDKNHPTAIQLQRLYQSLANHYQVAVGSHEGVTYPFDIESFAACYRFSIPLLQRMLRILEELKLVQYQPMQEHLAQVAFKVNSHELYLFQVKHCKVAPLIQRMLRYYACRIIGRLGYISIPQLAQMSQSKEEAVVSQLEYLSKYGVIDYHPAGEKGRLTFLTPRYAARSIPIDCTQLKRVKQGAEVRLNAMVDYLQALYPCRSQRLISYFGEQDGARCGKCDRCKEKPRPIDQEEYARYTTFILERLVRNQESIQSLIATFPLQERSMVLATLYRMLEESVLMINEDFFLTVVATG